MSLYAIEFFHIYAAVSLIPEPTLLRPNSGIDAY